MSIGKKLLPVILITFICCYAHTAIAENNPPAATNDATTKENATINTPSPASPAPSFTEGLKAEIKQTMKEEFLSEKVIAQDEYLNRLDKIDNKYQKELDRLWGYISHTGLIISIIASIVAILTFVGLKRYLTVYNQLTATMKLFDTMEKMTYEKEREINTKYDEIIGKKRSAYTRLDRANFLDYEHKLYFAYAYLPITKNVEAYKKSLFLLGEYWLENGDCGRALLRFQEIERIHNELIARDNIVAKFSRFISKDSLVRVRGVKTEKYYNLFGYACNLCADQEKEVHAKKELLDAALLNYKKAIRANSHYSSPYYNIGRLYGVDLNSNREALKWYAKAFGKDPDLFKETYRNMACSLIRLGDPTSIIITTLDKVPGNDPYWQDIIDDEVIGPKIKTTPELRSFVLKKFPQAKNIA